MKLFFNYSIDCELPPNTDYTGPERRPFFHGPSTWEAAESSVRGFVDRMSSLDADSGATLFVYPDVASHQRSLYRDLCDHGVEIALHLNGLRYSRLRGGAAKWLGEMSYEEQYEALRNAKGDIEEVLGKPCVGYRACYGSANDDTFPICEELGFRWSSNSSNRFRPEFFATWPGSFRFPHHPSRKSRLICGDMRLYEIPVTVGIDVYFDDSIRQPLDLRVEASPDIVGADRRKLREVIEENVIEMKRRASPVKAIVGASHNTNPYGDVNTVESQNLSWIVRHTRDVAATNELSFAPSSFADIANEADRLKAY